MKASTMIKAVLTLGSLAYSAYTLPSLMDKFSNVGKPGAPDPTAGVPGLSGLMGPQGALGAAVRGPNPGGAMGLLSALQGATAPSEGATAQATPLKASADDFVVFGADGKKLTKEQVERLKKAAATAAPLKPGALPITSTKGKPAPKTGKGAKAPVSGADPMTGVDEKAIEEITRQLQAELTRAKKP